MVKIRGAESYPFYFGASAETLRFAGELRHSMTKAERMLWKHLRNRQINGYRFRRQHPINNFIVDFFCYEVKLVIEVDGGVHLDKHQAERDSERTRILNKYGIEVIRFSNEEVINSPDHVIAIISKKISSCELE